MISNDGSFPASSFQTRFYYLENMTEKTSSINVQLVLSYTGTLNEEIFKSAVDMIVENNDILRTTFKETSNGLQQVVHEEFKPTVNVHDLRSKMSLVDYDDYLNDLAKKTFDVHELPLFEINIIKLDNNKVEVLTNFHHLIWDGWSQYLFYKELSDIYNSLMSGKHYNYKKRPQYTLYTSIEAEYSSGGLTNAIDYYRNYLKNYKEVKFSFIKDAASNSEDSEVILQLIKRETTARSRSAAKKLNCTLHEFMLSAFFATVHLYSKQDAISILIPRFNRFHYSFQKMYGPMLNALPIITKIDNETTFAEFVKQVAATIQSLYAFDHIPIDKLISEIRSLPEYSDKKFDMQILFNYISPEWANQVDLEGLNFHKERLVIPELNHLMTVYVSGDARNGEMGITFAYQKSKITRDAAEQFLQSYLCMLDMLADNITAKIDSIDIASDISKKIENNLSQVQKVDEFRPLVGDILHSIDSNRGKIFLKYGDQSYTYADLLQKIRNIYAYIAPLCKHGKNIVITGKRGLDFYAAMIASMAHRQCVFLLDQDKSPAEIRELLNDLSADLILCADAELDAVFDQYACRKLSVIELHDDVDVTMTDIMLDVSLIQSTDSAYIVSTSGSTGKPKLIVGSQSGLSHFINWQMQRFSITSDDTCAQMTNVAFDVVYREILTPMLAGASLSLHPDDSWLNTMDIYHWLKRDKVSFFHVVPSVLDVIIKSFSNHRQVIFSDLRYIFSAGEPLPDYLIACWNHAAYSNAKFVNLYGPSETTLAASYYIVANHPDRGIQPIGVGIDGVDLYIARDDLTPCVAYEAGQIAIRSPYVSKGYLGTSDSIFIPNPYTKASNDILYLTGDCGHLDSEGMIHIHGRADDQIKINGIKVHLGAIEHQISQLSAVSESAVLEVEGKNGKQVIAAFMVAESGREKLSRREIVNELHGKIKDYMIPDKFFYIDAIPKTQSGKKNRPLLKELSGSSDELVDVCTPPATLTEKAVHDIWCRIIGKDEISVVDSYDRLGINSLKAVQCLLETNSALHISVSPVDLARHNSIRDLSKLIDTLSTTKSTEDLHKLSIGDLKKYLQPLPNFIVDKTSQQNRHVLLTGVTGFLGSYIFKSLIEAEHDQVFYLMIRPSHDQDCLERIKLICEEFNIDYSKHQSKIKVINSDLSKSMFGLSREDYLHLAGLIDTVIHCGAYVNFSLPIADLKAANIDGTYEILKFATEHHLKPVSYISTAGIIPSTKELSQKTIYENDSMDFGDDIHIYGGYAQSKWVAECAVLDANRKGLPVKVYRVGRVAGDSRTGKWAENDFILSFLRTAHAVKAVPNLDVKIDLLPVDIAAQIIIKIHESEWDTDKCFHIVNPHKLSMSDLSTMMAEANDTLALTPYHDWRKTVVTEVQKGQPLPLSLFLHLLPEDIEDLPRLKFERNIAVFNTERRLAGTDVEFPRLDKGLIEKYLRYGYSLRQL